MKRILILANNDIGLYKFRKELIHELLKENEVYVSLPYGELVDPLKQMGCKFIDTFVDRRGINPIKDFKLMRDYLSIVKHVKPDMIITYTIKPNIYGGLIARLLHIQYAINITGLGTAFQKDNFIKKLVSFMYKFSCKKAKVIFFENEGNKEIFMKNKLIKEDQACVLNGAGVNLDEYPFTDYPQDNQEIRFLFIGRVMKEKGIDELLYVAKRTKEQYSHHVKFDIVGPMEDNYNEIIDQFVDESIINYYGYQSDVKPFISKCHCFILPSYHEGMANTLLECASMGRPLITSNIHGCKEAIKDNGYLCEVMNSDDLYMKIKKFIDLDYELKKKMGEQSRKYMESMFDKKKIVEQTLAKLL